MLLVDEDVSRRTVALSINAGKFTARTLARALQAAGRKIQEEHKTSRSHGKQTVAQLMKRGSSVSSIEIDAPRLFDKVARRWNVDYAFYQSKPGKYLLFFKSGQADAITACFSEYSRRVLGRSKERRLPIRVRLKQAAERVHRQPKQERQREVEREER